MCKDLQGFRRMFLLLLTLLFCSQCLESMADLELILMDYRFEYYDPDYFKDMETATWGNEVFINATIINYLPVEAELRIQLLGATMGEYKVPTGIDSIWPLCEALKEPIFVGSTLKYVVPPVEDCPPKLGTYTVEEVFDDISAFPDTFPPNNYLAKVTISTSEKTLLEIHCYASTR